MKNKKSNKILLGVLVVLAIIYFATNFLKDRSKSSVEIASIDVDTAQLAQIKLYPFSGQKEEIVFSKQGSEWNVKKGDIVSNVNSAQISNFLKTLADTKINRLISKKKEKWEEFRVTDSLATELKLYDNSGKEMLHLYCGRIKYNQPAGGYSQYGGQNFSGDTYVRMNDGYVYIVKGFLAMTLNRDFNSWRNNDFVKTSKDNITKVAFSYPADSSFVLEMIDSVWNVNGMPADSAKTANYLQALQNNTIGTFADGFAPQGNPEMTMTISGNNMADVQVKCYVDTASNQYILESSQNPGVYASTNTSGLFSRLLKSKSNFVQE